MKRFGFFNSINGDRKYLASDISEALDIATTTGIKQEEGVFEVTPHEDMTVKINPGSALIFGCFYSNDEDELIKLDIADGELNRIDRIAIRYDRFDRSIDTVVLKGTNALNPTPPTPLRNENQFDLVLADIYIRKATTEISASDITDMRESELCGYIGVEGAVSQLEFDAHLAESAKKHITESGSNQNGSYIKYDDGTMAMWGRDLAIIGMDKTYNVIYPATFNTVAEHYVAVNTSSASGQRYRAHALGANPTNYVQITLVDPDGKLATSGTESSIMWFAIGRWK